MKILFIGQLGIGTTTQMRHDVLVGMGHELSAVNSIAGWTNSNWIKRWAEKRTGLGKTIRNLNKEILEKAEENKPDLFWAEKQEYIYPATLKKIQNMGIRCLHFTPDPYFSLTWKRTAYMDACMPLWDDVICCKSYELDEYKKNCRHVVYMPLGFSEQIHKPCYPDDAGLKNKYSSDVGFLGGWEPRREKMLGSISKTGIDLKIWGYAWDHLIDGKWTLRRYFRLKANAGQEKFSIKKNPELAKCIQGGEVYGTEYAWALTGAKIGLGFLRHICPDQHTTRTFEISACKSLLLADRTKEHQEFFREGEEAEFFSSENEMLEKIKYYLKNDEKRKQIAEKGYQRCHESGYSYNARLSNVMEKLGLR